jgi:hypothetical protein
MVCGLPPGDHSLTSGCHGDNKAANFSPPVCNPIGEAGKNVKTGFFLWSAACQRLFPRDLRPATIVSVGEGVGGGGGQRIYVISIYVANGNLKKWAFHGTIRRILNVLAAHSEGLHYPPICLFDTLFWCKCPFKSDPYVSTLNSTVSG